MCFRWISRKFTFPRNELPLHQWTHVKLKVLRAVCHVFRIQAYASVQASGAGNSKGKMDHSDGAVASALSALSALCSLLWPSQPDEGVVMFINGTKVCEIPGTEYHTLPSLALWPSACWVGASETWNTSFCSEVAQMHIFFLDP